MSDSASKHDMFPKKGPEHESLARFAGTWRAEVKIYFAPGQGPQVSQGTMVNTLLLNGLFLGQDYHDDAGMFEGRGYWGYNTTDQRYEGFWIDPMASFFQLEQGQHNRATDTYEMRGSMTERSGKPMQKRSVIAFRSANEHTMEQYVTPPGCQEFKTMEIRYTRV